MATEKQAKDIDYKKNVLGSVGCTQTVPHTGCSRSRGYTKLDTGKSYEEMPLPRKENGLKIDHAGKKNLPNCAGFVETLGSPQIDIRELHKLQKELHQSGLENCKKETPELTTLIEKSKKGDSKHLCALAGVAMQQHKTTFDIFRKNIDNLESLALQMTHQVKKVRTQLEFLEELAVLNDIE